MSALAHQQTAFWLMALSGFLGPRERKFIGAMARMKKPSAAQLEWLGRVEARAISRAGKELRHA
jgi:hypothetical protein